MPRQRVHISLTIRPSRTNRMAAAIHHLLSATIRRRKRVSVVVSPRLRHAASSAIHTASPPIRSHSQRSSSDFEFVRLPVRSATSKLLVSTSLFGDTFTRRYAHMSNGQTVFYQNDLAQKERNKFINSWWRQKGGCLAVLALRCILFQMVFWVWATRNVEFCRITALSKGLGVLRHSNLGFNENIHYLEDASDSEVQRHLEECVCQKDVRRCLKQVNSFQSTRRVLLQITVTGAQEHTQKRIVFAGKRFD